MSEPTYILSAELDIASFAWLDGLRRAHFPPERNFLSAHLTMFHRLSREQDGRLDGIALPTGPVCLCFTEPIFLGFGVAIRARSPELEALRETIRTNMRDGLSRQDSQKWTPHVTIQNKVPADVARSLHQKLQIGFQARSASIVGLSVWEYLGGPWKLERRFAFPT